VRAAIVMLLFLYMAVVARAGDDLPVPRGSRADGAALISGDGFGPTVAFIGKELDRRGWAFHRIGPYRARGVDVARFLADDTRPPWIAIHVFRAQGKTWISFVKRAP
jgi:hypothetical protein